MPACAETLLDEVIASAFAIRRELPLDEWADAHRVMAASGSARPGRWDTSRVPPMRGVMRALSTPGIREVTLVKCAQSGGTEAVINALGQRIERGLGIGLVVYPNQTIAKKFCTERYAPALSAIPRVSAKLAELLKEEIHLVDGVVRFLGAQARYEGDPSPLAVIDEFDRCELAHREEDIRQTFRSRQVTFAEKLLVNLGTPGDEGVGIDRAYADSDQRRYAVPCVHCHAFHFREGLTARVRCPDDPEIPERVLDGLDGFTRVLAMRPEWVRAHAEFVCPVCGVASTARDNLRELRGGVWIATRKRDTQTDAESTVESITGPAKSARAEFAAEGAEFVHRLDWDQLRDPDKETKQRLDRLGIRVENPQPQSEHAGFHMPGLLRSMVEHGNPYGVLAAQLVQLGGRVTRSFITQEVGEPWKVTGERLHVSQLRERIQTETSLPDFYRLGEVHPDLIALAVFVDVQLDRLVCVVRGYGPGGVDSGLVWHAEPTHAAGDKLQALDALATAIYPVRASEGNPTHGLPVIAGAIDAQYDTDDVYAACLRLRRRGVHMVPTRGVERQGFGEPHTLTDLDKSNIRWARTTGLQVLNLNSSYWKGHMLGRIRGEVEGIDGLVTPGRFLLPEGTPNQYLKELTSEERRRETTREGRVQYAWRLRVAGADNHCWDCEVHGAAMMDRIGVATLSERGRRAIPIHAEDIGKLGPVRRGDDPARVATAKTQAKTQQRSAARTARKADPKLREMSQLTGQALDFLKRRDDD